MSQTDLMTEEKSKNTLEQYKFIDDPDGILGVLVKVYAKIAGGELTILSPDDFLITTLEVGDIPVKIPSTPATGRIAIDIRNLADPAVEGEKVLYVGPTSSVEANQNVGTNAGIVIGPGEGHNYSLRATKEPWAVAPAGITIKVQITEWIIL